MIDVKKKILIGGVKQRIHYLSNDLNNPVLLFLHGGPGVCNRHSIVKDHNDLLDTFTIVTWDQRGSGGSYFGVPKESLTISRMVDDAEELVEWCCKEFKKEKIFVIGEAGEVNLESCFLRNIQIKYLLFSDLDRLWILLRMKR